MKARTTVYLEPGQIDALRKKARRERASVAELIRWTGDVSERHDHYIGEALCREHIEDSDNR